MSSSLFPFLDWGGAAEFDSSACSLFVQISLLTPPCLHGAGTGSCLTCKSISAQLMMEIDAVHWAGTLPGLPVANQHGTGSIFINCFAWLPWTTKYFILASLLNVFSFFFFVVTVQNRACGTISTAVPGILELKINESKRNSLKTQLAVEVRHITAFSGFLCGQSLNKNKTMRFLILRGKWCKFNFSARSGGMKGRYFQSNNILQDRLVWRRGDHLFPSLNKF